MEKYLTIICTFLLLFGCAKNNTDNNVDNKTNNQETTTIEKYTTVGDLNLFDNIKSVELHFLSDNGSYNDAVLTFKSKDAENKFIDGIKTISDASILNEDGSFVDRDNRNITDNSALNPEESIENYYENSYDIKPFTIIINYESSSVSIEQVYSLGDGIHIEGVNGNNQKINGYYYYNDSNKLTKLVEDLVKDNLPYVRYVLSDSGKYAGICDYLHPLNYSNDTYTITSSAVESIDKTAMEQLNKYFVEYIESNNFEIYEDGNKLGSIPSDGFHYLVVVDENGNTYDLHYNSDPFIYSSTYIPDYKY